MTYLIPSTSLPAVDVYGLDVKAKEPPVYDVKGDSDSDVNAPKKPIKELVGEIAGRAATHVKAGCQYTLDRIRSLFQVIISTVSSIVTDSNALSNVFKKLQTCILPMAEVLRGAPDSFKKLKDVFNIARDTIDLAQLAQDIDYWINAKFKGDTFCYQAARFSLLFVNIFGTAAWLTDLGVINLSKAAAAIGNVRVFSFLPKVISYIPMAREVPALVDAAKTIGNFRIFSFVARWSLGFTANRILPFVYIFLAANSYQKLQTPLNAANVTLTKLDIAHNVSEVALDAIALFVTSNVIGLGLIGAGCLGLAVAKIAYKIIYRKELQQPLKLDQPVPVKA